MFRISKKVWCFSFVIILTSILCIRCKNTPSDQVTTSSPTVEEEIEMHSDSLNQWFETQFEEELAFDPEYKTRLGHKGAHNSEWTDASGQAESERLERVKKRQQYLKKQVDTTKLNAQTKLSYRMAMEKYTNEIENYDFRLYNYPFNQMFGAQSGTPAFMISIHKINDKQDALQYIDRLKGIKLKMEQLVENVRLREMNGIIPPIFVFGMILEDSRNVLKGQPFEKDASEKSTLLADFDKKVAAIDIKPSEKTELINAASTALLDSVMPAYRLLETTFVDQQKRATADDGVWKFPKGDQFYTRALRSVTTTDLSADEIHNIGLSEVKRIHGEMEKIMEKVKFEGSLQEFFEFMRKDEQFYYPNTQEGKEAYLAKAKDLIAVMKTRLDELFITKPKADLEVRAVEPFREKSAGKAFYYRGTPDGSRPGIYYANLYDMPSMPKYQMEALAYHEGLPGHHMQLSLAQELQDIPKFRKYGGYTAYTEGWGLYNEFLPKEIGMYEDPYSDFGRLAMELWRACRLVVDTGIHAKKWNRQEGIDYYKTNTPNAERDAVKMVERHIVMPGQATAYKIGMLKILELRAKAKKALGDRFDIREFHEVVLTNGAVPLNILEELVEEYITKTSSKKLT